jgi:hypothetical protein
MVTSILERVLSILKGIRVKTDGHLTVQVVALLLLLIGIGMVSVPAAFMVAGVLLFILMELT